jgi:metallophosphoesterase (TIGR00282 family)
MNATVPSLPGKADAQTLDLLFFGDIVGRAGRLAVKDYLDQLRQADAMPDLVVANVENASHGFGLIEKHYQDFVSYGIDVMTGGNHTWDRRDILGFIDNAQALLRPANFPSNLPGSGAKVFHTDKGKVGVLNLMGQVFMGHVDSPWEAAERLLPTLLAETPMVFIDLHAETTAEKTAFGMHVANLGVSAMVGTHTHVQTADERILVNMNGTPVMGYITDAGFNGSHRSVIGMEAKNSIERLKGPLPTRLEVSESNPVQVNGIRFWIDVNTGRCKHLQRVFEVLTLPGL